MSLRSFCLAASLAMACTSCFSAVRSDARTIESGFEASQLDPIWKTDKLEFGALELQNKTIRSGKQAAQITVKAKDIQGHNPDGTTNERAELQLEEEHWFDEDKTYDVRISLFVPNQFNIENSRAVILQMKQICPAQGQCKVDNPILSLRFRKGRFIVSRYGDSGSADELYTNRKASKELLGRWLDFKFLVRFSRKDTGLFQGWLDGKEIFKYLGISAYSEKVGYPAKNQFDFRTGIYRDTLPSADTIYVDQFFASEVTP